MTSANSLVWIDKLESSTLSYNARKHSKLHGLSPQLAHLKENESYLRSKFIADYEKHKKKYVGKLPRLKIGDTVRITVDKTTFGPRGYEHSTREDPATVKNIFYTYPITYELEGYKRKFYENELVKVNLPKTKTDKQFFIEKTRIVQPRISRSGARSGGTTEYLLKSRNDPLIKNWISETELKTLKDGGYIHS